MSRASGPSRLSPSRSGGDVSSTTAGRQLRTQDPDRLRAETEHARRQEHADEVAVAGDEGRPVGSLDEVGEHSDSASSGVRVTLHPLDLAHLAGTPRPPSRVGRELGFAPALERPEVDLAQPLVRLEGGRADASGSGQDLGSGLGGADERRADHGGERDRGEPPPELRRLAPAVLRQRSIRPRAQPALRVPVGLAVPHEVQARAQRTDRRECTACHGLTPAATRRRGMGRRG